MAGVEKGYVVDKITRLSDVTDEEIKKVSVNIEKSDYLRKWPIMFRKMK